MIAVKYGLAKVFFIRFVSLATALMACQVMGKDDVSGRGGSINYHGHRSLPAYTWSTASYSIQNRGKTQSQVKVRVTPLKQDNFAVYEIILPIPPETKLSARQPISSGTTTRYVMDLISGGQQVSNSSDYLTSEGGTRKNTDATTTRWCKLEGQTKSGPEEGYHP